MACIFLEFVDGKGFPVNLLPSPKPLPSAYKEPIDRAMFDSVLHVVQYKPSSGSATKSPGLKCFSENRSNIRKSCSVWSRLDCSTLYCVVLAVC